MGAGSKSERKESAVIHRAQNTEHDITYCWVEKDDRSSYKHLRTINLDVHMHFFSTSWYGQKIEE